MGPQLVKLDQNKVLVNLIYVQHESRVLNKGKTLGAVQSVGSVSRMSRDTTSHSTRSQSLLLLILNNIPDFTRAVPEGAELTAEHVSKCCELILEDTDRFVGHDGWMVRDKTLQMFIGVIGKQTRKLDKLAKPRLVKPWNLASVVCYASRQEGHIARCCPQKGNWGANPVPQSNYASTPGVVSTTQIANGTVQARTTTTRANSPAQQGVKTSAPPDNVSLSGRLLVIRVMFQWVVDMMN